MQAGTTSAMTTAFKGGTSALQAGGQSMWGARGGGCRALQGSCS